MTTRLFTNARFFGPGLDAEHPPSELLCRDGRVLALGHDLSRGRGDGEVDERVDFRGLWAFPGMIDPHVHFDEPGYTQREDFAHGTASALRGGVTTVIDMPCTSVPPVTSLASLREKLAAVGPRARVDFALFGGIEADRVECAEASYGALAEKSHPDDTDAIFSGAGSGAWREDLRALVEAGVVAVKAYTVSGMATYPAASPAALLSLMEEAATLAVPVAVHAEDPTIVDRLSEAAISKGRTDPASYADARPAAAECLAVAQVILLQGVSGAAVHVVHVASGEAAQMIQAARARGADISAETCPHYLAFTREDFLRLGALLKTAPVVKAASDRQELWELLVSGAISFVATDHAPCRYPEDKETGDIWTAYGGIPGTELMLPYLLSEGLARRGLSPQWLAEVGSSAAARRYGLYPQKGCLAPGSDCDLAVVDPSGSWTVDQAALASKGKYTPFHGQTLTGRVEMTVLRGELVFDRSGGFIAPPGTGRFIRRGGDA
jgi:dihydroorotase-like cyclic amidohydrolase